MSASNVREYRSLVEQLEAENAELRQQAENANALWRAACVSLRIERERAEGAVRLPTRPPRPARPFDPVTAAGGWTIRPSRRAAA